MTNAIETLYMKWVENYEDSLEMCKAFNVLCKENDITEENRKFNALGEAVIEEQKIAFEAGFRTAVQLLIGGVQ